MANVTAKQQEPSIHRTLHEDNAYHKSEKNTMANVLEVSNDEREVSKPPRLRASQFIYKHKVLS